MQFIVRIIEINVQIEVNPGTELFEILMKSGNSRLQA
jgi:hypothetical protein